MHQQWQGEGQPPSKRPRHASISPGKRAAAEQIALCIETSLLYFDYGFAAGDDAASGAVDALKNVSMAIEINNGLENPVCDIDMLKECEMNVLDALTFRIQCAAGLPPGNKREYLATLRAAFGGNLSPEQHSSMMASFRRTIYVPFQRIFAERQNQDNLVRAGVRPRRVRAVWPPIA